MRKETISLDKQNFATLAICAIRYCHGRQTYGRSKYCPNCGARMNEK